MKTTKQLIEEGNLLREYRTLMKIKQVDAAKMFDTEQGNYCRMEQGRLNSDYRLEEMRSKFYVWRGQEIKKLNDYIKYLKSL